MRKQRGITLIALVITIIVLLILAGISIQSIMGDDGLLTKAANAKQQTAIAQEVEQINLQYSDCQTDVALSGSIGAEVTALQLENEMNDAYGAGTVTVKQSGSKLIVTYTDSKRSYEISAELGRVESTLNWDEIFEVAAKHPDQVNSESIGIAEDGTAVNLDLWEWDVYSSGTKVCLSRYESSYSYNGYIGEYVNGKIIGKMPMYILDVEGGYTKFLPVTNLNATFYGATDLVEAPELPSTIEKMENTFNSCTNLVKAPKIPEKVTYMSSTFSGCNSLTGELRVNATSLNSCHDVLREAATNEGCDLILTGTSPKLNEILDTASENSNVRIGN